MPVEVAQEFNFKVDELNLFTKGMREQINDYADYGVEVAALFDAVCQGYFGQGKLPTLTPLDTVA
jgi:hypothetical protein